MCVCVSLCVYACVCASVYVLARALIQSITTKAFPHFSSLSFLFFLDTETEAHSWAGLAGQQAPGFLLFCLPALGLEGVPIFPVGLGNPNSDPHSCTASTLLLSLLSPQTFKNLLLLYNNPIEQAAGPSPGRFCDRQSPAARVF